MKCGTSTLQRILQAHPQVFIPEREIHFFDIDDIATHPDFNHYRSGRWHSPLQNSDNSLGWQWYSSLFASAPQAKACGDYSTMYLSSPLAARRIGALEKEIKVVVALRHPTARSYSEYWHLLRSGRATYSFEDTLRFEPRRVLNHSLYLDHLQTWLQYIPRSRLKVLFFEDLLSIPEAVVQDFCQFLTIDPDALPPESLKKHENSALTPQFPRMQYWKNRLLRSAGNLRYLNHGPEDNQVALNTGEFFSRLLSRAHSVVNPLRQQSPPPIKPETQRHLDNYFQKRLQGIDELLEIDAMYKWFPKI